MSLRLSKYVSFLQELFLTHHNPFVVHGGRGQTAQRLQKNLWIYGPVIQRASLDLRNLMAFDSEGGTRPLYMGDLIQ